MTAWQDQPPRSRRQVRQTERDETVGSSSTPEQDAPADPSFLGLARKGWEADARRASSTEGPPSSRSHGTSGRRAQQSGANQQSDASQPNPEPLAYITQSRLLTPSPDGPTDAVEQPSAEQRPAYRNSDYSPDSRRAAFRPVNPPLDVTPPVVVPRAETTSADAIQSPPASPRSDLTLTRRQMRELGLGGFASTPSVTDAAEAAAAAVAPPVEAVPVVPVPVVPVPVVPEPVIPVDEAPSVVAVPQQRVRLRDRVRQLAGETEAERAAAQQAAAVEAAAAHEAAVPPELIEPPAYQPFLGTSQDKVAVAQIVETPEESAASSLDAFASQFEVVSDDHTDDDVVVAELESLPEPVATFEELLFPSGAPVESTVEPESADGIPITFDPFVPDQYEAPAASPAAVPLFAAPVPSEAVPSRSVLSEFGLSELGFSEPEVAEPSVAVSVEPATPDVSGPAESYRPPFGHWSTQELIDDDEQPQESKLGRDVAATSGAITSNALVLPYLPTAEDMMSPLSGTGEILITGSINLPSSFGSTGAHPGRYDRSDVDALLEADDREDSDPGSAPVRAIRAISTNGASGDVINSMKPQKASRLPMILIVSAAVMAVGVVVLLVAGLIFKIF